MTDILTFAGVIGGLFVATALALAWIIDRWGR
jgi:hypothetical protein